MKKLILSFVLLLAFTTLNNTVAQDALTLLDKMDNIMFSPKDKQADVRMTLINKSDKEKVREALMLQKGTDKKLFKYTAPENQAGIGTLSLPDGVMWLYLPAFGKPKKISLLAKSQAFSGSDFSYEDMATTPYAERFEPSLIETTKDAYVLELSPIGDQSNYSKIVVSIDKNHYFPKQMSYYDAMDNKIKEAVYTYEQIGKYWNAKKVVMNNLKKNHQTIIELSNVKFDQGLTDDMFTVEFLAPEKYE
jgi:outer membrane lipoprotein-sorting protein